MRIADRRWICFSVNNLCHAEHVSLCGKLFFSTRTFKYDLIYAISQYSFLSFICSPVYFHSSRQFSATLALAGRRRRRVFSRKIDVDPILDEGKHLSLSRCPPFSSFFSLFSFSPFFFFFLFLVFLPSFAREPPQKSALARSRDYRTSAWLAKRKRLEAHDMTL